jgi:hypothetical protein
MKVENGIGDKRLGHKVGQSGREKKKNVQYAKKCIRLLLEKVGILKNTALQNVNPLHVLGVKKLNETQDVYCINVPDVRHFSLANGAIVHNSDAFRTLATGLSIVQQQQTHQHNATAYQRDRFGRQSNF